MNWHVDVPLAATPPSANVFQPLGFAAPESVNTLPSMFLFKKKKSNSTRKLFYHVSFCRQHIAGGREESGASEEKENLVCSCYFTICYDISRKVDGVGEPNQDIAAS